jgi:hypothetical protein
MQDMTMGAYLDLIEAGDYSLPPYLGNLELRELNRLYATGPATSTKWGRRASG